MQNTEHFKELLTAEKTKLEGELKTVSRQNPNNPSDWEPIIPEGTEREADPVDVADATIGFDTNASITADLEARYNRVMGALARLEEGTYGVCKVNGERIEEERLEADPSADTCIAHRDVV